MKRWLWSILVSIDQTCGVFLAPILFYRVQSPDETISSRLGKIKVAHGGIIPWRYPIARIMDMGLDIIDPNHSIESIEEDED